MNNDPATPIETLLVKSTPGARRSPRYHCRVNAICNESKPGDRENCEAAWSLAEVVEVALHGVALKGQKNFAPGTVLLLAPSISSWSPECVLCARVINVRPATDGVWLAGCEFIEPLSKSHLHVFLQNSK